MPRLSILQAIRKGRQIVPNYAAKRLATPLAKGYTDVWYDEEDEEWKRFSPTTQRDYQITAPVTPGSACILGAAALAMGMDLSDLVVENADFYVHPDFVLDKTLLVERPNGWVSDGWDFTPQSIARAEFPCAEWSDRSDYLPTVIAHLNDDHDPSRTEEANGTVARQDPWDEERIIGWLRSLGYNGEGNHKA